MKKIIDTIFIMTLAIFVFSSCANEPTDKINEKGEYILPTVVVDVPDITEYRIVRPDKCSDELKATAAALKIRLEEITGASIAIGTDYSSDSGKEILLGETKRIPSKEAAKSLLRYSSYVIKKTDNKIVICGGSDEAVDKAANLWLTHMVKDSYVCVPKSDKGYYFEPQVIIEKINVEGIDISEFSIFCDEAELKDEAKAIKDVFIKYSDVHPVITDNLYTTKNQIRLSFSEDISELSFTIEEGHINIGYSQRNINFGSERIDVALKNTKGKEATMDKKMNFSETLSCSYTKEELMKVLEYAYNSEGIIIGEQTPAILRNTVAHTVKDFKNATGQDLAMIGIDLRQANLAKIGESGVECIMADLIEFASKGGIITVSAHFSNPHHLDPNVYDPRGFLGKDDVWEELVTKGTDINESFTSELSAIADIFDVLEEKGIPVIWRPLHETNGSWFWFSMVQKFDDGTFYKVSEESFRNLWMYIYDYMTKERGLTNLIWVFSPNIGEEKSSMTAPLYGYPGDNYVDMVGMDWYTDGDYSKVNTTPSYADLTSTGKIFALTEFGPNSAKKAIKDQGQVQSEIFSCRDVIGYLEKMTGEGKKMAYMLAWAPPIHIAGLGYGDEFMNSPLTLSLEDTNKIFKEIRREK